MSGKLGAEIIRLWCASTDYSGDLAIDDKILARVVDAYRRIRNTLRFLLANVSDFDPATDTVPADQLLEIDRYALARASQLQADILGHYGVYEFHPVVAKLQVYCSEDLGAFYLDVLKDRPTPPAPKVAWPAAAPDRAVPDHHAMLRWMAPFCRSLQKKHGRCSANPRPSSSRSSGTLVPPMLRCWTSGTASAPPAKW